MNTSLYIIVVELLLELSQVLRYTPAARAVESADRLQILQVQFPTQLTGSPHTVEWGLTRTHAHAVAGHTVYRHETGGPQEMYYQYQVLLVHVIPLPVLEYMRW